MDVSDALSEVWILRTRLLWSWAAVLAAQAVLAVVLPGVPFLRLSPGGEWAFPRHQVAAWVLIGPALAVLWYVARTTHAIYGIGFAVAMVGGTLLLQLSWPRAMPALSAYLLWRLSVAIKAARTPPPLPGR